MNQDSKKEGLQPVYPQYMSGYYQQDEISLVDLWIALLAFKRVFLSSLVVLIVLGIIAITQLITPKHKMSTVLGIARYNDETIEAPASVVNRINVLILPDLTKKFLIDNNIGIFETKVSNPKNTNLIVIENMVKIENEALFLEFQNEIGLSVIESHRALLFDLNADLRRKISLEQSAGELNPLSFNEYNNKYETGMLRNVQLVKDRINELTENNNAIQFMANQSKTAALPLLVQMSDNNQKIAELIGKEFSLGQALSTNHRLYNKEVKQKKKIIIELEKQIQTEVTRISGIGKLSMNPVGLSHAKAYAIVIFLSLFLAFGVTLMSMFRAKVNERLAEEV